MPRPKTGRAAEYYLAVRVNDEMKAFLDTRENKSQYMLGLIHADSEWQDFHRVWVEKLKENTPSLFVMTDENDEDEEVENDS